MKSKEALVENKKPDFEAFAPSGWIYLVVGDCVWGRGKTIQTAFNRARKPKYYVVIEAIDGSYINGMGDIAIRKNTPMEDALFNVAVKENKYWYRVVYQKLPSEKNKRIKT